MSVDALNIAAAAAFLIVVAGVVMAGLDQWRAVRENGWRPTLPKIGFGLLVIGLLAEGLFLTWIGESEAAHIAALSPRDLSEDQRAKIGDACKQYSGRAVVVSSIASDPEAYRLATQLGDILQHAGFDVSDRRGNYFPIGATQFGISVKGPSSDIDFVDCLQDDLENNGKLEVDHNAAVSPDGTPVSVVVNVKPVSD